MTERSNFRDREAGLPHRPPLRMNRLARILVFAVFFFVGGSLSAGAGDGVTTLLETTNDPACQVLNRTKLLKSCLLKETAAGAAG